MLRKGPSRLMPCLASPASSFIAICVKDTARSGLLSVGGRFVGTYIRCAPVRVPLI